MARRKRYDIVRRWEGDPIIVVEDLPFRAADICNAGAVKINDEPIKDIPIKSKLSTCFIIKK